MILTGDSLHVLKTLDENSIDAVVSDPPYGLSFMNKGWDYDVPQVELWQEVYRVLKPGGHLLSFAGSRTYHRMAVNIEDAGFEIRDQIMWVYGSGFPKSLNIGKAVDKLKRGERVVELIDALLAEGKTLKELGEKAGIPSLESSYRDWTTDHKPEERSWNRLLEGLGFSEEDGLNIIERRKVKLGGGNAYTFREGEVRESTINITKGNSPYEGWGTALKPAHEPIVVARKPISEKSIAENTLKWGTGGINIDGCRVDNSDMKPRDNEVRTEKHTGGAMTGTINRKEVWSPQGRFPANFIHDGSDEVVGLFPESNHKNGASPKTGHWGNSGGTEIIKRNDSGSAARFFYCAKAGKSERNKGLEGFDTRDSNYRTEYRPTAGDSGDKGQDTPYAGTNRSGNVQNHHPTVKPIKLMQYLVKLVTPKDGTVLDPFNGSGTTGIAAKLEKFNYIGIELDPEYVAISEARIEAWEPEEQIRQMELV